MSFNQAQEEIDLLTAKHISLNVSFRATFSNQLFIFKNTNLNRILAKNFFHNKSDLIINVCQAPPYTVLAIKKLFKQISHNSNFSRAELWHFSEKFLTAMLTCLGPQKSLSSLKLNLFHPQHLREYTLERLAIRVPNLSKLYISFASDYNIHCKNLNDITKSLNCFLNLAELGLDLSGLPLMDEEVMILAKNIQRLKERIKKLKLNLSRMHHLRTRGVEGLAKSFTKLEKLTSLALDFSECPFVEDQDVEKLFASLKMIQNLAFTFRAPRKLTQKSLLLLLDHEDNRLEGIVQSAKRNLYEPTSSFSQLTSLNLDLSGWPKGEAEVAVNLEGSFRGFPNLKVLDLNLGENQILDQKHLTEIFINLIRLKDLSTLHLNFSGNNQNLTSQAIISLGHALKTLILVDFKLDVSKCLKITQAAWNSLFQDISSLKKLKNLSFNCANCKEISELEFQQLALSLKEMPLLAFLGLDFSSCDLNNTALQSLGFAIQNLKDLQALTLLIFGNKKITSEGFLSMSLGFSEAQSLAKVSLNIDSAILPKSAGKPSALISCLSGVKSLKSLKIEANRCSEAQLLGLSNHLVMLEHVVRIKLHFARGDWISPDTKSIFAKNMRRLRGLKEFELVVESNHVWFDGFTRIEWGMKDIQTGSQASQIAMYKIFLKRYMKSQRNKKWKLLMAILVFTLIPLLAVLLPSVLNKGAKIKGS